MLHPCDYIQFCRYLIRNQYYKRTGRPGDGVMLALEEERTGNGLTLPPELCSVLHTCVCVHVSPLCPQISGCIILGVSIYLKVSEDGNLVRASAL